MTVTPRRDEFLASAEKGNLLPVFREVLADGETPVSAFAKLGGGDYSFLLESVGQGGAGARYSVVGVSPRAVLKCQNRRAEVVWHDVDGSGRQSCAEWDADDPTRALAEVMAEWEPVCPDGLPRFWGGAVGFFSYDIVRAFETLPDAKEGARLPELLTVLTDTVVVFDHQRQTMKVVATPYVPRSERAGEAYDRAVERIEWVVDCLRGSDSRLSWLEPVADGQKTPWDVTGAPTAAFRREPFQDAVATCKERVLAGDVLATSLMQRLDVERGDASSFDMYRALRAVSPASYLYYLHFPEFQVMGSAEDTMVRCVDGRVLSCVSGASRQRPEDPLAREEARAELAADPSARAKQLALTDVARGDVGRVAKIGSLAVNEHLKVVDGCQSMRLVSTVEAELSEDASWHDLLRSVFPATWVTGLPKLRAVELAGECEPEARGVFGGAVGYVSYGGDMDVVCADKALLAEKDRVATATFARLDQHSQPKREYESAVFGAKDALSCVAQARGRK